MLVLQSVQQLRLDFESSTPQTPVLLLRQPVARLDAKMAAPAGSAGTPVPLKSPELLLLLRGGSIARFSDCWGKLFAKVGAASSAGGAEFTPIAAEPGDPRG